jgi:hypothetical protein
VADNFELFEEGIKVRAPDGSVVPVKSPEGYTPLSFRTAVAGAYTYFMQKGKVPTVEQLFISYPSYSKKIYAGIYVTEEFKEALLYRGVLGNDADSPGLSIEQQYALTILSDPTDRRTLAGKLRQMHIPAPRYQAWLKQPLFKEHLNKLTKEAYADYLPSIRTSMISKALEGDDKAQERILAITGEWDPNARSILDARTVVMTVIESVIKHVTDPEMRKSILADVQGAVVMFDVTNQKSLES